MRRVFLDPDGTSLGWLGVVVAAPTGVLYVNQCAGVACELRQQEGYFVPLGGPMLTAEGHLGTAVLTSAFHDGNACDFRLVGERIPLDRLAELEAAVSGVSYWTTRANGPDERISLRLDRARIAEIAEAWVPVLTPDGPGILVWDNCD